MSSNLAEAFNLARRNSVKNENDLMQENLFEEDAFGASVSEKYCSSLLEKYIPSALELPRECSQFSSFAAGLKRRNSNREDADVAFAGMNPHETLDAMRAREHGRFHTAKINRRLTTRSKESESSWF